MGGKTNHAIFAVLVCSLLSITKPAQQQDLTLLRHKSPENLQHESWWAVRTQEVQAGMNDTEEWRSSGPIGGNVISVNVSPVNPDEIYLLVYCNYSMSCIYRSPDAGQTWTKMATLSRGCYDMAVHPNDPETIFVLSSYTVFKSTNGGGNWTEYSLGYRNYGLYGQICINPQDPDILHIAGLHYPNYSDYCIATFKSTDGGVHWTAKYIEPNSRYGRAYCIAIDPSSPSILYLGGNYGDGTSQFERIYKSRNGGDSWQDVTGTVMGTPNSIIIDPTNPSKVYVGSTWGVFRSSNGGQSWEVNEGRAYAYALGMDPSNPSTLYAGYLNNCYRSLDGGVNWASFTAGLCGTCQDVLACAGRVYYGSYSGLYKSSDGGTTWKASHAGIKNNVIPAVAVARSSANVIYAEGSLNGWFKSTDFGNSWNRLPDFYRCDSIYTICVDSANPDNVILLAGG